MSEQLVNPTSSIGAVWPPAESSNDRLKGFYDELVQSPQDVEAFVEEFDRYRDRVKKHDAISRLSIRAVASTAAIRELDARDIALEGTIPLPDSGAAEDERRSIVYTAWNADNRQNDAADLLDTHRAVLDEVRAAPLRASHAYPDMRPRVIDRQMSETAKRELVGRFVELYASFGYDEHDVEDLLLNPDNTIAYLQDGQGVVSTAMAERATLDIKGHGPVEIAEITEAITRPAERGKGFYRVISKHLADRLHQDDQEPLEVIYGESNLAVRGVLIAAHQNGRRFSYFNRQEMGIKQLAFGIIQQSFKVEDGSEDRPYNDFALSYIPINR